MLNPNINNKIYFYLFKVNNRYDNIKLIALHKATKVCKLCYKQVQVLE